MDATYNVKQSYACKGYNMILADRLSLSRILTIMTKPRIITILSLCLVLMSRAGAAASTGDVWREATLYRDEWGAPHVYAENPFALAFVFGYAQAEDHAEQMLLSYRMANGRLAAVLGEQYADSDAFSLKMGHARLAATALASADPVTRALCEGFAMGVNAWLVDHAGEMPSWADGVKPQDILAFWHAFLMSMAPLELPDTYRRPPAMTTGNAWAMRPERSPEGRTTLVVNPHQHHGGFFQWYEAHLVTGDMKIYGATLRGLPVIVQGHNTVLGWAFTPNQPNFADVYVEEYEAPPRNPKDPRVRPDDGREHQTLLLLHYMAQSQPYHVRTEAGLELRHVPALIGERGPIFESVKHGLSSWLIGGYYDFGGLRQLVEMARAQTLDAFWSAMHMQQIPCFHVVYADRAGNICYLYNTKAGVRLAPVADGGGTVDTSSINHNWDAPVTYRVATVAWRAVFTPSQLPSILNPDSGFIQACGNPPWTATEPLALNPESWPPWLVRDQDSYRSRRVRHLLRQGVRSFRDHQSMLFDMVVPAAFDMIPALLRATEERAALVRNAHPNFHAGIALLSDWSRVAETTSPGMTFYHLWWTFVRVRAAESFPSEAAFYAAALHGAPAAQEIMLRSVEDAAQTLKNRYGTLEVPWGEAHRIRRGQRDEPMAGAYSGEPIFVASDYVLDRDRWVSTYGYGFAMVTQFGERPTSVSLLPFGASLRNDSPHFDDQLDLMLERRFKRVRFEDDDILRHAYRAMGKRVTLLPLGVPGAITLHAPGIIHARLRTETSPPESPPRNLIPFSLYIQPERTPVGAPVTVEMTVHVPRELCDDAGFDQLRIYRHEPGLEWQQVQHQGADAHTRVLYARDAALAAWYVVLGPAEAAGEARYHEAAALPESARQPDEAVGLDALLYAHRPQRGVTSERRMFRIDRHDQETYTETFSEPPPPSQDPDVADRVFHMERLDTDVEEEGDVARQPLPGIPGYHFGPAARERDTQDTGEQERVFHVERLDVSDDSDETEVTDTHTLPSQVSDARADDAAAVSAEAPLPRADETLTDTMEQQQQRPPLPDVIPMDPAFVFGPAGASHDRVRDTEGRVFHIERHE